MRNFKYHPKARDEFLESVEYYDTESSGLGIEFYLAVEKLIEFLLEFPEAGHQEETGEFSFVMKRFPFTVSYLLEDDLLFIVAIAHHSRNQGYWKKRIEKD